MRELALAVTLGLCGGVLAAAQPAASSRIRWADVVPLQTRLESHGITAVSFDEFVARTHTESVRRVREGDIDHLVFYLLQSTRFTSLPPIEPALSAKAFVESVDARVREAFLHGAGTRVPAISPAVRARVSALLSALSKPTQDPRLTYFRSLLRAETAAAAAAAADRETWLVGEYVRVMRFVYQKEFVAQRSSNAAEAVAELYRTRGLSTDTAVEAGYLVSQGLGVSKALAPGSRIRRVLIIGPGLDLAPRTGLIEEGPPESYQPWAVIDALLSLGLSRPDDLEVVGADINPRVVDHLRRAHAVPPRLTLVSEIGESDRISFTPEFRDYFRALGHAIGEIGPGPTNGPAGHLGKVVRVGAPAARVLQAEQLDIVTERLTGKPFDLVVVTNVLPYFDDVQLMLALRNIAAMLAPGGVLLHNEARPLLQEVTAALGLPVEQSRHAVIATVRGAAAPLFDSVWLHRSQRR